MTKKPYELIQSGKASFKIETPYRLFETGASDKSKPLVVYLHGYNQTMKGFREQCRPLMNLKSYHLFIQAPYPIYDRKGQKKVSEWGRAWYLYDGEQEQFIRSLDQASRFIGEIIGTTVKNLNCSRICLLGYSMGGYLAGYHAINWPQQVNDLIICGARFKTELLNGDFDKISHISILALHGNADKKVESGPQRVEIEALKNESIDAEYMEVNAAHEFSESFADNAIDWLSEKGYTSVMT